jgi:hypothetical protein
VGEYIKADIKETGCEPESCDSEQKINVNMSEEVN